MEKNTENTPPPPSLPLFEWLNSERDFALNYLRKHYPRLSPSDVFGEVCIRQAKAGNKAVSTFERGVLVEKLDQAALSILAKHYALKRGSQFEHVEFSKLEVFAVSDDRIPSQEVQELDDLKLVENVLTDLAHSLNRKQRILAEVIVQSLGTGGELSDRRQDCTPEQRRAFMTNSRGEYNASDAAFRKEVNRAFHAIIKRIRKKFGQPTTD